VLACCGLLTLGELLNKGTELLLLLLFCLSFMCVSFFCPFARSFFIIAFGLLSKQANNYRTQVDYDLLTRRSSTVTGDCLRRNVMSVHLHKAHHYNKGMEGIGGNSRLAMHWRTEFRFLVR
jgi:hypothetical protein